MIVMGIDASTSATGWSIFDGSQLVAYGVIKPKKNEDWRQRLIQEWEPLSTIIEKYKPNKIIMEDVPLGGNGGPKMIALLGAVQGFFLGIASFYNIQIDFITPTNWRTAVSLFNGTTEGKKRDVLKKKSIEKANELFGLSLKWVSPSSLKNEDDISDAILIAYSKVKRKVLGR